jgi:hypothetical protein
MSYLPARRAFVMKTAPAEEATMNLSGNPEHRDAYVLSVEPAGRATMITPAAARKAS